MGKRVVIALGGNAIKQPDEWGTAEEQMRNVSVAGHQIAEIARRGYEIAITHGNGPQVGNLSIQQDQAQHLVYKCFVIIDYTSLRNWALNLMGKTNEFQGLITDLVVHIPFLASFPLGFYLGLIELRGLSSTQNSLSKKRRSSSRTSIR